MTRILAIDVGNTRAKYGVFETTAAALPTAIAISATPLADVESAAVDSLADDLLSWLQSHGVRDVEHCIIAGSNPPQRIILTEHLQAKGFTLRVVDHFSQVPVGIDVDQPETVGIDRLLTAYAARNLVTKTQPIVVVDSGTATTVNLITSDGNFRGGAILPGLRMSAYAMHDYTARLPLIDSDTLTDNDAEAVRIPVLGRKTVDAMKAGLFWGQLGAVREIAAKLEAEAMETFGEVGPASIVLTGGGGRQLVSQLPQAVYVDCLALHGLAMIQAQQ